MPRDLGTLSLAEIQKLLERTIIEGETLEHRLTSFTRNQVRDGSRATRLAYLKQVTIPRYREERNRRFKDLRSRITQSL